MEIIILFLFIGIIFYVLVSNKTKQMKNSKHEKELIERKIQKHNAKKNKRISENQTLSLKEFKFNSIAVNDNHSCILNATNNDEEEYEFFKKISFEYLDDFVKNLISGNYKIAWKANNVIKKIEIISKSYFIEPCQNGLWLYTSTNQFIGIIKKISVYQINKNNRIINFFIKDNLYIEDIPMGVDNLFVSIYFEHLSASRTTTMQSVPFSILMYELNKRAHQITVQETDVKFPFGNNFYTNILVRNYDFEPQIYNNIVSYYLSEVGINCACNVYNGDYDLKLPLIWENNYFLLEEYRNKAYNLKVYNGNKVIHYIKNVNNCFSLMKKVSNAGSVLCEAFNDDNTDYDNVSLIKLNKNGTTDIFCTHSPEFKTMYDYITSYRALDIDFELVDKDEYVNIYYFKKECLNFYILDDYTNNADEKIILKNKFDDDVTVNYKVKYKKTRFLDIAFVYYLLNARRGASLSFDNGLYGTKLVNNKFAGTAIFGVPFLDYYKGLKGEFAYINVTSQHYLEEEQINNFQLYVKNIYELYNLPYDENVLPHEFIKNEIAADIMLDKLGNFVNNNSEYRIDSRTMKVYNAQQGEVADFKILKENVKKELISSKRYKTKWKSEVELYNLVLEYYPNAVYQYRPKFLGMQSLDIYIPEIKTAIEYQGEQHYKAIDLFGGVEALNKRIYLDNKKRKLCKTNNIKLIEWKYTEAINKHSLDRYIQDVLNDV